MSELRREALTSTRDIGVVKDDIDDIGLGSSYGDLCLGLGEARSEQ